MTDRIKNIWNKFRAGNFREFISYGFWGAATSAFYIAVFQLLFRMFGVDDRVSKITAIITTKILAYVANKFFVFKNRCESKKALFAEILKFTVTRGATMLLDYYGYILLKKSLNIEPEIGNVISMAAVIIINYFFGKFYVYTKKEKHEK